MEDLADTGGIFTQMPRQDIEALIAAAVPNGGVTLHEYPFEASGIPHYHLMMDRKVHSQPEQRQAIRAVVKNAFDAANAQRASLAIEIAYW